MDQVYQLAHILLFRRLGVSVQSIKGCMTSFYVDQYGQLLNRSLIEINDELLRLQELFISRTDFTRLFQLNDKCDNSHQIKYALLPEQG